MCVHVTVNTNIGTIITFPVFPSNIQQPPTSKYNNIYKIQYYTRINWCSDWAYHVGLCHFLRLSSRRHVHFNLFNLRQGAVKGCQGSFVSDHSSEESKCFMYVTSTPILANITAPLALLRHHSPHPPLTHPPSVLDVTAACVHDAASSVLVVWGVTWSSMFH